MSEHADKIDDALKAEIEAAVNDAKALSAEAPVEDIKAKVATLNSVSMKIGQAMYSNTKKEGENNDGAKEAEYTESNKDEKNEKK